MAVLPLCRGFLQRLTAPFLYSHGDFDTRALYQVPVAIHYRGVQLSIFVTEGVIIIIDWYYRSNDMPTRADACLPRDMRAYKTHLLIERAGEEIPKLYSKRVKNRRSFTKI